MYAKVNFLRSFVNLITIRLRLRSRAYTSHEVLMEPEPGILAHTDKDVDFHTYSPQNSALKWCLH